VGIALGDHARVVVQDMPEVTVLGEVAEDTARLVADLAMASIGQGQGHDPSSNELLGMTRIGSPGELLGGHENRRCNQSGGHGILLAGLSMVRLSQMPRIEPTRGTRYSAPSGFTSGKSRSQLVE